MSTAKSKGGGVLVAVNVDIFVSQICIDHITCKYEDIDAICLKIASFSNSTLTFILLYIAPDIRVFLFEQFLDDILGFLSNHRQLLVIGDFNVPSFITLLRQILMTVN